MSAVILFTNDCSETQIDTHTHTHARTHARARARARLIAVPGVVEP